MPSPTTEVTVGGRTLRLSNLDKVLYPRTGFTKGEVIDYYARVAPALLPHLAGRPLTLKRYPDGVEGPYFYEKRAPPHRPRWVHTIPIWSSGKSRDIEFCVVDDLPTLIWAANLADLELHVPLSKGKAIHRPTAVVFDLDPGPPAGLVDCCDVATSLRDLLDSLGLESHPKTSGGKGLQVYVPLNGPVTYDQTKPFAHAIAEELERDRPNLVVSNMRKSLRTAKVFIDWSQNDEHKTTVCVYSLRAQEQPTVSTPLFWEEVARCLRRKDPGSLVFGPDEVLARVKKHGDLFRLVLERKQSLPRF